MLTVEDEYTREGLAVEVGRSMPSGQVKAVLRQLSAERGPPGYIRSDNAAGGCPLRMYYGPEFIAHELTDWLKEKRVATQTRDPCRTPTERASAPRYAGRV